MVHKKYTYRGGKRYGPYLYKNKRVGNKIITTYLGRAPKKNLDLNYSYALLGLALVMLFAFSFVLIGELKLREIFFGPDQIPVRLTLPSFSVVELGQKIEGSAEIGMLCGELIPVDTIVRVDVNGEKKEESLLNLIEVEPNEGEFYIYGTDVSGSGNGYGCEGEKEVVKEITFDIVLDVEETPEKDEEEEIPPVLPDDEDLTGEKDEDEEETDDEEGSEEVEEEPVEAEETEEEFEEGEIDDDEETKDDGEISENVGEEPEEESSEIESGEVSGDDGSSGSSEDSGGDDSGGDSEGSDGSGDGGGSDDSGEDSGGDPSGDGEGEPDLSPSVDLNNEYTFSLGVRESYRIENIKDEDGEELDSSVLIVKEGEDGTVRISTSYMKKVRGFGLDYLSEEEFNVDIDLGDFGFVILEDGLALRVDIIYDGKILFGKDVISGKEEIIEEPEIIEPIEPIEEIVAGEFVIEARVGEPKVWTERILLSEVKVDDTGQIIFEIPSSSEKIIVEKIESDEVKDKIREDETGDIDATFDVEETPPVPPEVGDGDPILEEVIEEEPIIVGEEPVESEEEIIEEEIQLGPGEIVITGKSVPDDVKRPGGIQEILISYGPDDQEIEVSYETPGPIAIEKTIVNGKEVTIVGGDVHFTNVLAFADIPESAESSIKLYRTTDGDREFTEIIKYNDVNGDGLVDNIEWIVPELSNQTYEIIVIIAAVHLDENRTFVSDIYEEVNELDGIWSETIPEQHYVRVTFEVNLTYDRDITVYPRIISGTPRIEVYEIDGSEIIAEFGNLSNEEYNKVYLNNLSNRTQDRFDLRIVNGDLEFDHIIDPTVIVGNPFGDVDLAILNETNGMFVIAYCHEGDADLIFEVWYTNGTQYGSTQVNANVGGTCRVEVSAFNETAFVISYIDETAGGGEGGSSDWRVTGYDIDGNEFISEITVDSDTNTNVDVGICTLSDVRYASVVHDDLDDHNTFVIYDLASVVTGQTDVDTSNALLLTDTDLVDCAAINSTSWVYAYFDSEPTDENVFSMYDEIGTETKGRTVIGGSNGAGAVSVTGLKNGGFVIFYCDDTNGYASFHTYDGGGNSISGEIDVDQTVGDCGGAAGTKVEVSSLDTIDEQFAVIFDDTTTDDSYMAVYNVSGDEILAPTKLDDTNQFDKAVSIAGYDSVRGSSVCEYNPEGIIVAYNNLTDAVWESYLSDGSVWDGTCEFVPPALNISFVDPTPLDSSSASTLFVNISSQDDFGGHYTFLDFDKSVMLWMTMDDRNTSNDPLDLSSYSNNGSAKGNSRNDTFGYWGDSYFFDGNNDYVQVEDSSSLNLKNQITISFWTNPQTWQTGLDNIMGKGGPCNVGSQQGYNMYVLQSNGNGVMRMCDGSVVASTIVPDMLDKWSHVVGVYNGTDFAVYQNGTFLGSDPITGDVSSSDVLLIGYDAGTSSIQGRIDDFMIFNRSLSNQEILSLYNSTANQYGHDFSDSELGPHSFRGYGVNKPGDWGQTEERTVTLTSGELTECGVLGEAGETYLLANNIPIASGDCFTISANNITLDGQGYTIDCDDCSSGDNGITVDDRENITIKNINITRFDKGIFLTNTNRSFILDSNISNQTHSGISLSYSFENTISRNTFEKNGFYAVDIRDSNLNEVSNNLMQGRTTYGVDIQFSEFNNILNNTVIGPGVAGIFLTSKAFNNYIINNTISQALWGVWFTQDSGWNVISGGLINGSRQSAIRVNTLSNVSDTNFSKIKITNTNLSWYDLQILEEMNGIYFSDMFYLGNYTFNATNSGIISFKDSRFGEIKFIDGFNNGTGSNLSNDIRIRNNSVIVESVNNIGLNVSANITLYGIGDRGFLNPQIYRDLLICGSVCSNFTGLQENTVRFNVSSWTEYRIDGESLYDLNITDPTIDDPAYVFYDKNLTLIFDFSFNGSDVISGVMVDDVTVGGISASAHLTSFSIYSDFEGGWNNWVSDSLIEGDENWTRDSNGTFSGSTGPCNGGAGTSCGAEGTEWYLYVETSNAECNTNGEVAIVWQSQEIDFNSWQNEKIEWWNNMYGVQIGTLELQENTTGSWNTLWTRSGNAGTPWFKNETDLSSLNGVGNIRFKYTCAGGITGDAAIDQINISGNFPQIWHTTGSEWKANVSVPEGLSGTQDLFVQASNGSGNAFDIEVDAVDYDEPSINLRISVPTTEFPASVKDYDNITITFDYLINGENVTQEVEINNVTIGDVHAQVFNDSGFDQNEFFEEWESGLINPNIWSNYSNETGRIYTSTDSNYVYKGVYGLVMDSASSGTFALNELITNISFDGATEVYLDFFHDEKSDKSHIGDDHIGQDHDGDSYYFTCDGMNWKHLGDLGSPVGWAQVNVNITADPDWCGVADENFKIKITQFDDDSAPARGRFFDDINIIYVTQMTKQPRFVDGKGWVVDVIVPALGSGIHDLIVNASGEVGNAVGNETKSVGWWAAIPPSVILNDPQNRTSFGSNQVVILNATVFDESPGDILRGRMYGVPKGRNDTYANGWLYENITFINASEMIYNWSYPTILPQPSMVLLMHMDNNSDFGENDTFVYDYSGNGNHGTRLGDCRAERESGIIVGAMHCESNGPLTDRIEIPESPEFDITGNMTIVAWIRPTRELNEMSIVNKDARGFIISDRGFNLYYRHSGNKLRFYDGSGANVDSNEGTIEFNSWNHVAVVSNHTTVTFYVNGEFAGDDATQDHSIRENDNNISIGSFPSDSPGILDAGFAGYIDDLAIFNRTLSGDELRDLYELKADTYVWKVNVTDSIGNNEESVSWEFTIDTLPSVVLNSPDNDTRYPEGTESVELNVTVFDKNSGDLLDVFIYGTNSSGTNYMNESLLHQEYDVINGSTVVYNWTSPLIAPGGGLVGLYHLDNNSRFGEDDTLVYDFAGGDDNGSVDGPVANYSGRFAGAFEFGVSDEIDIPDDLVKGEDEMTVSAWVKHDRPSGSGDEDIVDQQAPGGSDDVFRLYRRVATQQYRFIVANTGGTGVSATSSAFADTEWHHVVGTYDGSNVKIFVDGVEEDSSPHSGTIEDSSDDNLVIGTNAVLTDGMNGLIDEVGIWTRALSDDEVRDLYQLSAGKYFWKAEVRDSPGFSNESETREFRLQSNDIVWICPSADDFDNPNCWDLGRIPQEGDNVVFNGSGIGDSNITQDKMPQNLDSFIVEPGYTGIISFNKLFAKGTWGANLGTQVWNVAGNINISGGTMKVFGDYPYNISYDGNGQVWKSGAGNITIGKGARVDGVGLGFPACVGPGVIENAGGSYGGMGDILASSLIANITYGDPENPTGLGSGGCNSGNGEAGGSGIKLDASNGEARIDGVVIMNGQTQNLNDRVGAGGSIWILAKNISGGGHLNASGGISSTSRGGGGGRIKFDFDGVEYGGVIDADGGKSLNLNGIGRPGTFFFDSTLGITVENTWPTDLVMNGSFGFASGFYTIDGGLVVPFGRRLGVHPLDSDAASGDGQGVVLTIRGDLVVEEGGIIDGRREGFADGYGPASGGANEGGGHGGKGGSSGGGGATANPYGNGQNPVSLGSGGDPAMEGFGGGAIKITATGPTNIIIDGNISMIGDYGGGIGGAGGSINLIATGGNIGGKGMIDVSGSMGSAAGGGGGRIALNANTINFSGKLIGIGGVEDDGDNLGHASGGSIYVTATTSVSGSGNMTTVGLNGGNISLIDSYFNISGTYNATAKDEDTGDNGTILIDFSNCESLFDDATFYPEPQLGAPCIAPFVILNSPTNATTYTVAGNTTLNVTVYDNNESIDVRIFGANSSNTQYFYDHGLLYQEFNVANGSDVIYNFSSPVIIPDDSTVLLLHLDNNSRFDESDNLVYDFAGGDQNGTVNGDAYPNISGGKLGGSFVFDGSTDWVDVGKLNLSSLSGVTVASWVSWAEDAGAEHTIVSNWDLVGTNAELLLRLEPSGNHVEGFARTSLGQVGGSFSDITVNDQFWHHVVMVYDSSDGLSAYVDGIKSSTTFTANGNFDLGESDNNFRVGDSPHQAGDEFTGAIDEVVVWNRTLSDRQIKDSYKLGKSKYFWKVNVSDTSINKNNNESETWEFSIGDIVPPQVTINFPENDAIYFEEELPLNFNVSLNETGTVEYTMDGGFNNHTMSTINNYNFTDSNDSLAPGSYTFQVYAKDDAGNINYDESADFTFEKRNVTSCRDFEVPGVTYRLIQNITADANPCFRFLDNHLGLDGQGFSIESDGTGQAFFASSKTNVSVKNAKIVNFETGIYFTTVSNGHVVNNTISDNLDNGIYLVTSSSNNLSYNIIKNASNEGIKLDSPSTNNYIGQNVILNSSNYGLSALLNSDDNRIFGNNISGQGGGIFLNRNFDNEIRGGELYDLGGNAITLDEVDRTIITNISFSEIVPNYDIFFDEGNGLVKLIDNVHIGKYSLQGDGTQLHIESSGGIITFAETLTGNGNNFSDDIKIIDNLATVESDSNNGLNKSANVTLYNMSGRFSEPEILRNDLECPSSVCNNFTSLKVDNVKFSVTGWTSYSLGDNVKITECRNLTTPNTGYTLENDVSSDDVCIRIQADNITLDGQGNNINASGSALYGVIVEGVPGAVIRDLGVNYFLVGINVSGSRDSSIMNSTGNCFGIWCSVLNVERSNNTLIRGNDLVCEGILCSSIYLVSSNRSVIDGNDLDSCDGINCFGVFLQLGSGNNVTNNNVTSNQFAGIYVDESTGNEIKDNNASHGAYGIYLYDSADSRVLNNEITFNSIDGIRTDGTGGSMIKNNYITRNGVYGINLNSAGNIVLDNEVNENSDGISVIASEQLIANNILNSNGIGLSGAITFGTQGNNTIINVSINGSYINAIKFTQVGQSAIGNVFDNVTVKNTNVSKADFVINGYALNHTTFIDTKFGNYTISKSGGIMKFVSSDFGEIQFFEAINGSGANFSEDVFIGNNSVIVRSDLNIGLNVSANVTFYGIGDRGFGELAILRDGEACSTDICNNITALDEDIVRFNVTHWTKYEIGDLSNKRPNVTLFTPSDGENVTDRTPNFTWIGFDSDGDDITFEFNLTCYHSSGGGCTDRGIDDNLSVTDEEYYQVLQDLLYLSDNGYYYNWSVRANDSEGYGNWAPTRRLNIQALIDLVLINDTINFGEIAIGANNDTVDDSPPPFALENNGNVFVNVSINATDLWSTDPNPTENYQYKIDNYTGEDGAFSWIHSVTTFMNMPGVIPSLAIVEFNYTNATNVCEVDLNITAPIGELAGTKESSVWFTGSLSE